MHRGADCGLLIAITSLVHKLLMYTYQKAPGENGNKFGEQSELTSVKLKNSEREAIGAGYLPGNCAQATRTFPQCARKVLSDSQGLEYLQSC